MSGDTFATTRQFLREASEILYRLEIDTLDSLIQEFVKLKQRNGRLFIIGTGGSAANASHAVNDFRKLADIEAYCPSDNVAELTARINDDGWGTAYVGWLMASRLNSNDLILTLSVGGGSQEHNLSVNLINAMSYAHGLGTPIVGIVGRDGGFTATVATVCIIIPTVHPEHVTPLVESFQSLFCHLIVSDPRLAVVKPRWESI